MIQFPLKYINGNYQVTLLEDGTKIRYTIDNEFYPSRPETLDINISNYCENNCPWCYLDATLKGKHGNLDHPFFDTISKYTEIAINYAKHPRLEEFLERMKKQDIVVNMTINEIDLLLDWPMILDWQKKYNLIYGLGVSISQKDPDTKWIVKYFDNVVAHTIYGITSFNDYKWISESFDKVLVLGYKNKGRGKKIIPKKQFDITKLYDLFDIVSFDNLGIEQSKIKENISEKELAQSFMGEEGTSSFFLDTVEEKYYKSSMETIGFDIGSKSVIEMFKSIGEENETTD